MKLSRLLEGMDYTLVKGTIEVDIEEIQYNSRKVKKEDVFFCIRGYSADGHNYAVSAVGRGASVVFCEKDIQIESPVTVIKVKDTRKAMAIAAANYYGRPSDRLKLIGITGTNGKTTSTYMIKAILEEAGHKVGLIGTIANLVGNEKLHADRTTPESLELQQLFDYMVKKGMEYCVMEVSSHSLELDRVYSVNFKY
ncbi:MAG: Mur ligase family protein, partial [Bacillota bacterium]|nr:Mur ligase family protein [Bacillota bacterium]